jgi:RNA polymerase sigma-70 factor (ECF subfamily)
LDEQDLITRATAGDGAAERALYEAHVGWVFRLAYRMTGDETLAEDFTQETFVRAFQRLSGFRGDAAFSTWLHAIATSVVLNGLRRVKRHRDRETVLEAAEQRTVSSDAGRPDLLRRLRRAIDELSDPLRLVVVMHDMEGFKHHEIAAALNIPTGTSKARLSRARAALRAALQTSALDAIQQEGR